MSRRRRDRSEDKLEALVKLVATLLMLTALGIGGLKGFVPALISLIIALGVVAVVGGAMFLLVRHLRRASAQRAVIDVTALPIAETAPAATEPVRRANLSSAAPTDRTTKSSWTSKTIRAALEEIDWYQFEKFCAALLTADGFSVERKGGAQPDGGVDLLVEKHGQRGLIQCKHWRNWVVQEKVVREMLGSMTAFKVGQGAIYTLKGWTQSAARFAAEHHVDLVDGNELARSAESQLTHAQLESLLNDSQHHCPKCEALMVWRTGDFEPFWGCSRYPRCRGILKHSGAR